MLPRTVTWSALVVVLLMSAAAPTASAGSPLHHLTPFSVDIEVHPHPRPIAPIRETVQTAIEVTVRCHGPLPNMDLAPRALHYEIHTDRPWAHVTIDKTMSQFLFQPQECVSGAERREHVVATITMTEQAPAFEQVLFWFSATADSGEADVAEWTQKAGFYERWQARFEKNLFVAATNERVVVPLTYLNMGNGPIMVMARLDDDSSSDLIVATPVPQIVPSKNGGAETGRLDLLVELDTMSTTGRHRLILDLEGRSAQDDSIPIQPLQLTAFIEVRSDFPDPMPELPAIGPVFSVLGLVGLAWARRYV